MERAQMMHGAVMILLCSLLLAGAAARGQDDPAAGVGTGVSGFAWLSGCWNGELKAGRYTECWTAPGGDGMQGSARIVRDGKTTFREFMLLERRDDGVFLTVQQFGSGMAPKAAAVTFRLVRSGQQEAVFENPAHDHPQRILYGREGECGLVARIENLDGSRGVDFPMRRSGATACR